MRSNHYLVVTLFSLSFVGCKIKPTPLYTYDIRIKLVDHLSGDRIITKEDTVMAINDGEAYSRGVLKATAQKRSDKITGNRVYNFKSYYLFDSKGRDVNSKLPKRFKDSVDAVFESLNK